MAILRRAGFTVLVGVYLNPGALIEPLFITDPFVGSIAASGHGQQAIAAGVARGIEQHFAAEVRVVRRRATRYSPCSRHATARDVFGLAGTYTLFLRGLFGRVPVGQNCTKRMPVRVDSGNDWIPITVDVSFPTNTIQRMSNCYRRGTMRVNNILAAFRATLRATTKSAEEARDERR
jgi:hypothetical protein